MPEWKNMFQLYLIHRLFFCSFINCMKPLISLTMMVMTTDKGCIDRDDSVNYDIIGATT